MEINSAFQAEDSDHLRMYISGTKNWKYTTFNKAVDTKTFKFFEQFSKFHNLLVGVNKVFATGAHVNTEIDKQIYTQIDQEIESFQESVTNTSILGKLHSLKSKLKKDWVTRLKEKLANCDFTLYKEFLNKVKIFHSQSNEKSLKGVN
jgi:hypothetical protein